MYTKMIDLDDFILSSKVVPRQANLQHRTKARMNESSIIFVYSYIEMKSWYTPGILH